MFLCGASLSLVGACIAGPPTVRGCIEGLRVRQRRASNARPYYIIGKSGGVFAWACLLLVGACMAGPPTVRGRIFGVAGAARAGVFGVGAGRNAEAAFGTPGRSQAPPLRWNYKMAIKISRILLRFIVGVGLCSTRGALRQHKALAGEQCSPLLYNRKGWGCFCVRLAFRL